MEFCTGADYAVLLFMQDISNQFLDVFLKIITYMGNGGAMWIILGAGMLIFPKTRKKGLFCLLSLALAALLGNGILKPVISRVRPYDMFDWISVKIIKPTDGSFPSGHTMSSFAFSMALLLVCRKWGVFALIFSCLMGFSRLYFQVHFLTDVLAGMILGILCAVIVYGIAAKIPWFEVGRKNAKLARG